jgi:hypothetical protein
VTLSSSDLDRLHADARQHRLDADRDGSAAGRMARAHALFTLWRGEPEGVTEVDPVRELSDLVSHLRERLEHHGVPFVIGGSFALAAHGNPRFTYNLDVMVQTDLSRVQDALDDPRYEQMNGVSYRETSTDLLVDVHPVRDQAQRWAADEAVLVEAFGDEVRVLTAEGLAVMLLREATEGEPEVAPLRLRDLELLARHPGLDWEPVQRWARQAGYEQAYEAIDAGDKPEL